jgi:hypothetical protein
MTWRPGLGPNDGKSFADKQDNELYTSNGIGFENFRQLEKRLATPAAQRIRPPVRGAPSIATFGRSSPDCC